MVLAAEELSTVFSVSSSVESPDEVLSAALSSTSLPSAASLLILSVVSSFSVSSSDVSTFSSSDVSRETFTI